MEECIQFVKTAAKNLDLLEGDGSLKVLDSFAQIDLVVELERVSGISIPTSAIQPELFTSIENIAEFLDELR